MTNFVCKKLDQLNADNAVFLISGFKDVVPANSTKNIEWQFPQERWGGGLHLLVKNGNWGDSINFYIIIKDVNGNDAAVRQFADSFNVNPDSTLQGFFQAPYINLAPQNAYVRIRYTNSNSLTAVSVAVNFYTHIPYDIANPGV